MEIAKHREIHMPRHNPNVPSICQFHNIINWISNEKSPHIELGYIT